MSNSEEEEIARDYICYENPDVTVVVVDATCLERNLNLVYQILEITPYVIVCVNLLDEAKKKKISVNLETLENELNVPVVGTTARDKKTLYLFLSKVYNLCLNKKCSPKSVTYFSELENAIALLMPHINNLLNKNNFKNTYISRWLCLKLIEGNQNIINSIERNLNLDFSTNKDIQNALIKVDSYLKKNNITPTILKEKVVSSIIQTAENIESKVCTFKRSTYSNRDKKIDKILTSKLTRFSYNVSILRFNILSYNCSSKLSFYMAF